MGFKPVQRPIIVRPDDTPDNHQRLRACIDELRSFEQNFIRACGLLAHLEASGLWMLTHSDFGEFVRDVFSYSRRWAKEMVAANRGYNLLKFHGETSVELASTFLPKLTSVRALACIGRVRPEFVVPVAIEAEKLALGHKITESDIIEAKKIICPGSASKSSGRESISGYVVKICHLLDQIQRNSEGSAVVQYVVNQVRSLLERIEE